MVGGGGGGGLIVVVLCGADFSAVSVISVAVTTTFEVHVVATTAGAVAACTVRTKIFVVPCCIAVVGASSFSATRTFVGTGAIGMAIKSGFSAA